METLVERATRLGVKTHTVSEMLDVIENTQGAMGDLAMLTKRLAQALRKAAPDNDLPAQALDYISRTRIGDSPYRKVGAGDTAEGRRCELGENRYNCGGDVPAVRAGCANWKTHNAEVRGGAHNGLNEGK